MDSNEELDLEQLDIRIKKCENKRTVGIVLVVISLFCLWPLMIVGIIMWVSANKEINFCMEQKYLIKKDSLSNEVKKSTMTENDEKKTDDKTDNQQNNEEK